MSWIVIDTIQFFAPFTGNFIKQYEVPFSWMLHDMLEDDHIQWHPPLIRHYNNFRPCYWYRHYYSNVETNLSWTCLVSGLFIFEHPSVLAFLYLMPFPVCKALARSNHDLPYVWSVIVVYWTFPLHFCIVNVKFWISRRYRGFVIGMRPAWGLSLSRK